MSAARAVPRISAHNALTGLKIQARSAPPPPSFLLPGLASNWCQRRTFLTRRSTSFWTQSFPPQTVSSGNSAAFVPSVPPSPSSPPHEGARAESSRQGHERAAVDGKRKERKQRYLDSLMEKAGDLSLRCSIIDAEGNWRAEEGRYKKSELCKEYDLDPRDLRKLDSLTPNLVPIIITRRSCILISMLHIRALIQPERVIIFDTAGTVESEVQRRFKWHLERNVRAGIKAREHEDGEDDPVLPYEHRALESILVATANALEEEMTFTRQLVQQLLADLEDDINRDNLKRLLHYSRRIVGFQSRARYVKRAVDEILDNDEDLSAMYLTDRARGKPRALHDHEQLEVLLESFGKQVEEIVSEVDTTVANMQSTQEIAELMLDSGRNALLALDIKISIATLGVGTGALVAGFFGMNLTSHFEESTYGFYAASGSAALLATLVFVYGIRVLRRVRRVALTGKTPRRGLVLFGRAPTMEPTPPWETQLEDHFRCNDPISGAPWAQPAAIKAQGALRRKLAIWDWILRRKGHVPGNSGDPVWINRAADMARARDAMHGQRLEQAEHGDQDRRGWEDRMKAVEKIRAGRMKAWEKGEWEPGWEAASWKWGRGKPKWAKE